jgi:signal transduction histidine kinase
VARTGRTRSWLSERFLERGEGAIASIGLAAAVVLLGSLGFSAWWAGVKTSRALDEARSLHLRSLAQTIAHSSEALLAESGAGGLSSVRSIVNNAALADGLSVARIVLSDGSVLADSEPSRINVRELPQSWPVGVASETENDWVGRREGAATAEEQIFIPGGGPATLLLADGETSHASQLASMHVGVGAIGASAMLLVLVAYRSLRARLRGIAALRDALHAVASGESSSAALQLGRNFGPEAAAWNQLLAEREELRHKALENRAAGKLSPRGDVVGREGDLLSACDALSYGMLLVDDRLSVRYVNGAGAAFLRCKREDVAGKDALRLLDDPRLTEAVRGVATGHHKQRSTIEIARDEDRGGGVLRYTIRPVRRDDQAAALVLIEDMTQQRIADSSRNSFVAQATHELRTPLTNIRLYVESLLEGGADDALQRSKGLNVISQETRRLERIIGDMLSVAEIEAGSLRLRTGDVRLETLFPELEAEFIETARAKDIRLSFDLPPKLPVIHGDRDKLVQAAHNLVANAIKYTPAGGSVNVRAITDDKNIGIEVSDSGIGISPGEQDKIFEKFYRAKDKRIGSITGSGLGLSLAREIARMHGGDITVQSEIDKGSTFTLNVPTRAAA